VNRTKTVYALRCPIKNEVFYVGCSCDPKRRLREHRGEIGYASSATKIIKDIEGAGERVDYIELEVVDWDAGQHREIYWTAVFLRAGNPLVNYETRYKIFDDFRVCVGG